MSSGCVGTATERVSRSGCFHCVFIVCQVLVTSFLIASYALCLCMCVHAFVLALSVCNLVGFLLPALSLCVSFVPKRWQGHLLYRTNLKLVKVLFLQNA